AVQSFEQAAAIAGFGKVPAVARTPQTVEGLVKAVHIRAQPQRLDLIFELADGERRVLEATRPAVRQALFVMRRLYAIAGWPADIWPEWVANPAAIPPEGAGNRP